MTYVTGRPNCSTLFQLNHIIGTFHSPIIWFGLRKVWLDLITFAKEGTFAFAFVKFTVLRNQFIHRLAGCLTGGIVEKYALTVRLVTMLPLTI